MGMKPLLYTATGIVGAGTLHYYAGSGGFVHADDIRTLATSSNSLSAQVSIVKKFAEAND